MEIFHYFLLLNYIATLALRIPLLPTITPKPQTLFLLLCLLDVVSYGAAVYAYTVYPTATAVVVYVSWAVCAVQIAVTHKVRLRDWCARLFRRTPRVPNHNLPQDLRNNGEYISYYKLEGSCGCAYEVEGEGEVKVSPCQTNSCHYHGKSLQELHLSERR